ncbi:MAG: hypothetical protein MJK15_00580 [Colwellia sp.]|nr:hypothetical protein [Colwellia sp.]
MSTVNGSNSAFPLFDSTGAHAESGGANTLGMTKREYIALTFMNTLVARGKHADNIEGTLAALAAIRNKAFMLADSFLEGVEL